MQEISVIVGLQFGDEGKGKITDYLSDKYDVVARFNGGTNAGHTVVTQDGVFKFHLVPSGSLRTKMVILGNGMVIDPFALIDEISKIRAVNRDLVVKVSFNAHIVTKMHKVLDNMEEKMRSSMSIGTTAQGIGPTYEDKYARTGIRMFDLLDLSILKEKIESIYGMKSNLLKDTEFSEKNKRDSMAGELYEVGLKLKEYMDYTENVIYESYSSGKNILFEGAQGLLLDPDFGFYPFVTSSNTISASAFTGTGFSLRKVKKIIGVAKAYISKVGEGPFATEMFGDEAKKLREAGGEYGTTTGRPRRVGWLDLPMLKYSLMLDDVDQIALTKVDTLGIMDEIKVCEAYEIDGKKSKFPPKDIKTVQNFKPVYRSFEPWGDIADMIGKKVIEKSDLPEKLIKYIDFIEKETGIPISIISAGKERKSTVEINK